MSTPRYRAQVTLDRTTNLAEDRVVNVLHFEGDDDPVADDRERWDLLANGLVSRIATFYQALSPYFAATVVAAATIDLYDMRDPKPRIPRVTHPFNLAARGEGALPAEVALCLSMSAALEAGANAARRRGRIYLGPFAYSQASNAPTAGDSRPSSGVIAAILAAADVMATGNDGAARLAVYSPTTDPAGDGSPDAAWNDVVTLWIDDAWDTQRRRGAKATTRQQVTV